MTQQADESPGASGGGFFAERRIFIRSETGTRYYRISTRAQIAAAAGVALALVWIVGATVSFALATLERRAQEDQIAALEISYEARIAELAGEQAELADSLQKAESQISSLSLELTKQQSRLIDAAASEQELTIGLATLRAKLRDAVMIRDSVLAESTNMSRELHSVESRLEAIRSAEVDLSETLETVSSALGDAVTTRDEALSTTEELARKVEAMEADMRTAAERRERVFSKLEDAVQVGLGAMEGVFKKAGLNVDTLVEAVRREYSGSGGPFIPVDASLMLEDEEEDRMSSLIGDLERVGLMQIAAAKLPFGQPVRSAHRYTSGFGVRRDPKNGRHRQHNGADFASASGTPIYATGEGVVVEAGWHSGFGRMVKIRHGFGYSTLYAHMRKLRVKKGDRVARGDRIGDMGSSGRSTGTHLHYEIRVGGKPVNPIKYIEAARNVF